MALFINYVRDETRSTPLNLAAARMILASYLVWKTVWYDWPRLLATPFTVADTYTFLVPASPAVLVVEKWVLIGLLVLVLVGYRLGLTTFLSALLVGHLGAVRYTVNTSGGTTALFFSVYFLVLFGLYRDQDVLTADVLWRALRRRLTHDTAGERRSSPETAIPRSPAFEGASYPMTALKYDLVVIAIVYFGGGVDKLLSGGLAWAGPANLSRIILVRNALYSQPVPIGPSLLQYPVLVSAAAVGTLVLELGLLVAVVARLPIGPFVVGVLGMQTVIAVAIGPFFFDVFVFFAMFLPWDTLYSRLGGPPPYRGSTSDA
ncbi:hypothetical protein [Halococcus hamelinensis]|uniref:HTTM domain-containing protein n=1 Tax=Halococcus hamelinensis 100A6 TaxID=1132509 RepID=M0LYL2_9EURY|nr:hypothetical protein [Halococcus hamelinensis]EMA38677.1 hypothetical protein C447_09070 [Halococcus hamelinensis 100A6]